MAWISSTEGKTMTLTSKTSSASTYNEAGTEEYRSLGTVVNRVVYNQRFDQTEITEVYEFDGLDKETAERWLGESPATRTKTWAKVCVNPNETVEEWKVYLDYLASEIVETRSIAQSSSAGSYRATKTIVTQTTVPVSASDPVE